MKEIQKRLRYLEDQELYPDLKIVGNSADPEIEMNGEKKILFSTNNYLGLANHPKILHETIEAIKLFGVGSGGSRILSGNFELHNIAERQIADFKDAEDAIIFSSGYAANVGVIPALTSLIKFNLKTAFARGTIIFSDELNHASIIDGCKLSKQTTVVYKHNDMNDLEKKLKSYKSRRKLIITDGVFSMDGDIAHLDKIAKLAKEYNALTMVDDAHSTGVLGKTGRGTCEHFNLKPGKDIDIVMGTLSKALGSQGGYVVGNRDLIKYVRILARSQMFSTAVTPGISAAVMAAFDIIIKDSSMREKLLENSLYLRNGFTKLGFDICKSETQIIPILVGPEDKAIAFAQRLYEEGLFAPCVRWPAVPKGQARIRFTVMAKHTKEHMDFLLSKAEKIGHEFEII